MKSLGYGRLISLDNFRQPNFELIADILYFFCDRIDSSIDLSDDISTKLKRVEFIKNCANILASKCQIKLKLKNLYKSDGYAVKELLKIANFLNDANNINQDNDNDINNHSITTTNDLQTNLNKLREYTNLGGKIVENGVKLHNLLNNNDANGNYNKIIDERIILFLDEMSHNIENYDNIIKKNIEHKLSQTINDIDDNINDLEQEKMIEIKENIGILRQKVSDKENELDRLNKRLLSLKNIKPAFIEEYEILEEKNIEIYDLYCEKFKNLSYLQSELNKYRAIEYEKELKTKKKLKSVQQKLRQQEMKLLTNVNDDVDDLDILDNFSGNSSSQRRSGGGSSGRHRRRDRPEMNRRQSRDAMNTGFSESGSMIGSTRSNTNTNTGSNSSSGSSSMGSSSVSSPTQDGSMVSRSNDDDGSIGSISDIGDEHMQF